jgi:phosphate-selective porin OprO/OprP
MAATRIRAGKRQIPSKRSIRRRAATCALGYALLAAMAPAVSAQAPVEDAPPTLVDYADTNQFENADPNGEAAASIVIDRQTIQDIVREELAAEKALEVPEVPAQPFTECIEPADGRALSARWENGFVAETADQAFRFHIGGRLEFDNSWFSQDNNILIGTSPDQEMLDGTLMRRARFRADGRLYEYVDFACEVNFANIQDISSADTSTVQVGSVGLTDFYVTFRDLPWVGNARIGHLQAPLSLERYSSSNAWYYMERSSMFDAFYNPNDYQNGVVLFDSYLEDRMTLAGSAAWIGKSDVQPFAFGANEGKYAAGCRITALPVYEAEGCRLMHLGAGYFHQSITENRFSLASRPLVRAGAGGTQTPNLVFTGIFFTPEGADVANLELALVRGPLSLSGEYAVTHVNEVFEQATPVFAGPRGDVTYHAAYLEAGWFVTPGDRRRYDVKTGTWARTVPLENAALARGDCARTSSLGAVQLVSRYTYLDLVSGDPVLTPTAGGARAGLQHDVTLGVNWYLNSQMWFMVNYVATRIDSVVPGADGDIHGIGCRLHLDF